MDITLPSHLVCYDLFERAVLVDPNIGRKCRGGNIYIPEAAEVAANAGVVVDIGQANAALTDITQPDLPPLIEGSNYNIPQDIKNTWPLKSRFIQASVDNAVVRLGLNYA